MQKPQEDRHGFEKGKIDLTLLYSSIKISFILLFTSLYYTILYIMKDDSPFTIKSIHPESTSETESVEVNADFCFTSSRSYMFLALVLIDIIHDSQQQRTKSINSNVAGNVEAKLDGIPLRFLVYAQINDLCAGRGNTIKPTIFRTFFKGILQAFIRMGMDLQMFFKYPCVIRTSDDITKNLDILISETIIKVRTGFEKHALISMLNFIPSHHNPEVLIIGNRNIDSIENVKKSKTLLLAKKQPNLPYVNYDCSQNGLIRMFLEEFGYHTGLPGLYDSGANMPSKSGIKLKSHTNTGNCNFNLFFDLFGELSTNEDSTSDRFGITATYTSASCKISTMCSGDCSEYCKIYSKSLPSATNLRISAAMLRELVETTAATTASHLKSTQPLTYRFVNQKDRLSHILVQLNGTEMFSVNYVSEKRYYKITSKLLETVIELFEDVYYQHLEDYGALNDLIEITSTILGVGTSNITQLVTVWKNCIYSLELQSESVENSYEINLEEELAIFCNEIGYSECLTNITGLKASIESQLENSSKTNTDFWFNELVKTRYYLSRLGIPIFYGLNKKDVELLDKFESNLTKPKDYIDSLKRWVPMLKTYLLKIEENRGKYEGVSIFLDMFSKTMGDIGQILYSMKRGHLFATEDTMAAAIAMFLLTTFSPSQSNFFGVVYGGSQDYIVTAHN